MRPIPTKLAIQYPHMSKEQQQEALRHLAMIREAERRGLRNPQVDTSEADVISHGMALQAKAEGIAKERAGITHELKNESSDDQLFADLADLGVEVTFRKTQGKETSQVTPAPPHIEIPVRPIPAKLALRLMQFPEESRFRIISAAKAQYCALKGQQTMKTFPDPLTAMLPPSPELLALSAMQSRGVKSDVQEEPQLKLSSDKQKSPENGQSQPTK